MRTLAAIVIAAALAVGTVGTADAATSHIKWPRATPYGIGCCTK